MGHGLGIHFGYGYLCGYRARARCPLAPPGSLTSDYIAVIARRATHGTEMRLPAAAAPPTGSAQQFGSAARHARIMARIRNATFLDKSVLQFMRASLKYEHMNGYKVLKKIASKGATYAKENA
jgi:hypothetical protein